MSLFGNNNVAGELAKLQAARANLESEAIEGAAQLSELRQTLADVELGVLLEGGDSSQARRDIADLEAKLAGLASARPPLLAKIRQAIKNNAHGKAEALRSQAGPIRKTLAAYRTKFAELLQALEQHAGVKFQMVLHQFPPAGQVFGPGELPALEPRSSAMERQLALLLQEADDTEKTAAATVAAGGSITASTLSELLAVCDDIERLVPSRAAIEAFFLTASARADADWSRIMEEFPVSAGPGPARRDLYTLVFDRDGVILPQSTCVSRAMSPFDSGQAQAAEAAFIAGHRLSSGAGAGAYGGEG